MAVQTVLSGIKKAAIVTLLLGEDATSEVFRYLSEEEIERLAREMAMLGSVPQETSEKVLEEFHHTLVAAEFVTKGDLNNARRLLVRTLGEQSAQRLGTIRRFEIERQAPLVAVRLHPVRGHSGVT